MSKAQLIFRIRLFRILNLELATKDPGRWWIHLAVAGAGQRATWGNQGSSRYPGSLWCQWWQDLGVPGWASSTRGYKLWSPALHIPWMNLATGDWSCPRGNRLCCCTRKSSDKMHTLKINFYSLLPCWRRLLRVPWTARRSNQSILKQISPKYSLEGLMLNWNSNTLATWCKELTHWTRPWCWRGLKAGGEGDGRGWDGWQTWVWVSSGS